MRGELEGAGDVPLGSLGRFPAVKLRGRFSAVLGLVASVAPVLRFTPQKSCGAYCGRSLLQGSLPFTPHTLSNLAQEKTASPPGPSPAY
jgi:hypothetical protein